MSKVLKLETGNFELAQWAVDQMCRYLGDDDHIYPEERVRLKLEDVFQDVEFNYSEIPDKWKVIYGHADAWAFGPEYNPHNMRTNSGKTTLNIFDLKAGIHKPQYFYQAAGYALAKMIDLNEPGAMMRILYYDQKFERYMYVTRAQARVMAFEALSNRLRHAPEPIVNDNCQYCAHILTCKAVGQAVRDLYALETCGFNYSRENADQVYFLAGIAEKAKARAREVIYENASLGNQGNYKVSTVKGKRTINSERFLGWLPNIGMKVAQLADAITIKKKEAEEAVRRYLESQNAKIEDEADRIPEEIPAAIYDEAEDSQKINPNKKYNPLSEDL